MAKMAQLADGELLEFPDETPDEVMDSTVQRHIAEKKAPKETEVAYAEAIRTLSDLVRSAHEKPDNSESQISAITDQTEAQVHVALASMEAMKSMADQLTDAVGGLTLQLAGVEENTSHVPALIESIDALSETIKDASTRIVETLLLPNYVRRDKNELVTEVGRKISKK